MRRTDLVVLASLSLTLATCGANGSGLNVANPDGGGTAGMGGAGAPPSVDSS